MLDRLDCAQRQISLPSEFGGLNVPSLELDDELAQYTLFTTTFANFIKYNESESLGHVYCLIREHLLNVAASTLPWAVELRSSYDTISTMGGFSVSDLVVAPATEWTRLHFPTPDAFTRSGDYGGHIQWGISRILRARTYLELLAFCKPSPPDYMRVILGTGRGALPLFFASHESIFNVPSDCYTMASHRVLGLIAELASHAS
jgi:hypothetical protein